MIDIRVSSGHYQYCYDTHHLIASLQNISNSNISSHEISPNVLRRGICNYHLLSHQKLFLCNTVSTILMTSDEPEMKLYYLQLLIVVTNSEIGTDHYKRLFLY